MSTITRPTVPALGPRLSAMMFLEFFVWGGWYVTVGNFLKGNGMMEAIPWAYSLCPIAAIVSPFFLGMVADRFFATERVLAVMQLLGGVCLLIAPQVASPESQTAFIGVLLLHTLFFMPTVSLANSLSFHHLTNREKQFPIIRVCGTIGWIVANFIVSKVLHGDALPIQFYVAGSAAVLLGLYSFTLPHTPPPAAGKRATARDILGLDSLALMRNRSFAVFMISSFLICIPLAFYYSYAPVFVGGLVKDAAFHMSFGQMSEVFFMLVMPICFARLGVKWMLAVGMMAWVARYGFFAAAADTHLMPLVVAGIVLHGICYDFFFVTGQIYVDEAANPKIRGQAQGFLVLVTQGIGMLIGAQVAGRLVTANTVGEEIAWTSVWLIPCIAAGVIMLAFLALFRDTSKSAAPEDVPAGAAT